MQSNVEPNAVTVVHPGQHISVLYRKERISEFYGYDEVVLAALYAGPGGDARQENYGQDYAITALVVLFAAILLALSIRRFFQMVAAARAPIKTYLQVKGISSDRGLSNVVRAFQAWNGLDMEWRVLGKPQLPEAVSIGGRTECGRWLVIQLPDGQFIWPASRAQPVIGTGMQQVHQKDFDSNSLLSAERRLLAAYAQILNQLDSLPFLIRRPPGQQLQSGWWWWLGAPRAVVRSLVGAHVRKRLHALSNALMRAAALNELVYTGATRSALRAASEQCMDLAGTLPRSAWRAMTAFVITTAIPLILTTYTAFVQAPPIHLRFGFIQILGLLVAIFVFFASPLVFSHSVRCKRVMFRPSIAARPTPEGVKVTDQEWNVYQLERNAFLSLGLNVPSEWEARRLIRWLPVEVYVLAIAVPILIIGGPIPLGELILAVIMALFLCVIVGVLTAVGGIPGLIQIHQQYGLAQLLKQFRRKSLFLRFP